jgi:omega-amidase
MQDDIRIGLVPIESKVGETEVNLNRITRWAEEASNKGVKLLCFPESALHGYSPQDASELGDSLTGAPIRRLSECASDLGMVLLVGMVERSAHKDKPYLSQLIAYPAKEPDVYRKVHLGRNEQKSFTAGEVFPVFEAFGVRFAIGICWDWHFPELATIYSLKGAEIHFAPHASPIVSGDRKEIWLRYLGARAYDNSIYLGACNLIGANGKGKEFSGGALVFGPKGDVLAEAFNRKEELLVHTLSAERINHLRAPGRASMRDSFFLADRRKELYKELLELEIGIEDKQG